MSGDEVEALPRRLGEFELETVIGEGETGTIYRALRGLDGRFNLRLFGRAYTCDEQARLLLFVGLQARCELRHAYIHEVVEGPLLVGRSIASPMRSLRGRDLAALINARGAMSWPSVRAIVLDVCRGLAYAHDQGIVHGDLKPENCFVQDPLPAIGREKRALVMGFGLAAAYRRSFPPAPEGAPEEALRAAFPVYMAPEQVEGREPDARSDIYALGVMIGHLLTGERPRASGWPPAVERLDAPTDAYRRDTAEPDRLPPAVEAEVLKATARDPAARHASVGALVEALLRADSSAEASKLLAKYREPPPALATVGAEIEPRSAMMLVWGIYVISLLARQCMTV